MKKCNIGSVWIGLANQINWSQIAAIMQIMNWEWSPCNIPPTENELKKAARELLIDLIDSGESEISSGGLTLSRFEDEITMTFCIAEAVYFFQDDSKGIENN